MGKAAAKQLDKDRVIYLYDKFGTMARTALSLDCSPGYLKKFLVANNIPIKEHKPKNFNINEVRTR